MGPGPGWVWGCRGLQWCPCTQMFVWDPQQLHTRTHHPDERDTLGPPDETLHPSSIPDNSQGGTQGQLPAAPPNEAANQGGALMSGVAVFPLWQLHQPLSPPSPLQFPPRGSHPLLAAATRPRCDMAIRARGYLMAQGGLAAHLDTGRAQRCQGGSTGQHQAAEVSDCCLSVCLSLHPSMGCTAREESKAGGKQLGTHQHPQTPGQD